MVIGEHGQNWTLSGAPHHLWDDEQLVELKNITGKDFEAVNVLPLMLDPNSGQVKYQ